jgi:hypothetical protein
MLVGLAARAPAVTPVPESEIFNEGFEALLLMTILPLAAPAAPGVNVAVKLVLCPAERVKGTEIPLRLNPDPLANAWLMVTLEDPLFVRLMVCA